MDRKQLAKFVKLDKIRRELELNLKSVMEERGKLEVSLLSQFESEGIQNIKVNGLTIYLHRRIFASVKDKDKDRAIKALRAAGLKEYVKNNFNLNSVTAWIREGEKEGRKMPKKMGEAFDIAEKFSLNTLKS